MQARRWQRLGVYGGLAVLTILAVDLLLHGPLSRADAKLLDAVTPWAQRFPLHLIGEWLSWPGSVPGAISITAVVVITWWLRGARRLAAWAWLAASWPALP